VIPTPIPDELIADGEHRRVFAAPDGDLLNEDIRPVEALISRDSSTDLAAIKVRLVLEDNEIDRLQAGKPVWLTMLGGLTPFDVQVEA